MRSVSNYCAPQTIYSSESQFLLSLYTYIYSSFLKMTSLVAQTVENLPVMQETWFQALDWGDPLEKGMATPVLLPGEFHGQRSVAGLQSVESQRVRHD